MASPRGGAPPRPLPPPRTGRPRGRRPPRRRCRRSVRSCRRGRRSGRARPCPAAPRREPRPRLRRWLPLEGRWSWWPLERRLWWPSWLWSWWPCPVGRLWWPSWLWSWWPFRGVLLWWSVRCRPSLRYPASSRQPSRDRRSSRPSSRRSSWVPDRLPVRWPGSQRLMAPRAVASVHRRPRTPRGQRAQQRAGPGRKLPQHCVPASCLGYRRARPRARAERSPPRRRRRGGPCAGLRRWRRRSPGR